MTDQKYYQDIKNFPLQFSEAIEIAKRMKFNKTFKKLLITGMGGSALYAELINDHLAFIKSKFRVNVSRSYDIPSDTDEETLIVIASHSGNTEETISGFEQALKMNSPICVFTSGGELLRLAEEHDVPVFLMPKGGQPRLATGYFITAILYLLSTQGIISNYEEMLLRISARLSSYLDEELSKTISSNIKGKVPIIYSTDNNSSLARISKIKFNENSKTQAFWNFFPELNHNEMVGFTNLVMCPYFIIFKSQLTHVRNNMRIEIFSELMGQKGLDVKIIDLKGESVLEEILFGYYFIDHVTYYLALEYGIDPEPVEMVEEFKKILNSKS